MVGQAQAPSGGSSSSLTSLCSYCHIHLGSALNLCPVMSHISHISHLSDPNRGFNTHLSFMPYTHAHVQYVTDQRDLKWPFICWNGQVNSIFCLKKTQCLSHTGPLAVGLKGVGGSITKDHLGFAAVIMDVNGVGVFSNVLLPNISAKTLWSQHFPILM